MIGVGVLPMVTGLSELGPKLVHGQEPHREPAEEAGRISRLEAVMVAMRLGILPSE